MIHEFALDLKVARRKAGLTQADCAHLLGVHPSKISLLESGKATPTMRELTLLSLIYGKPFERLFSSVVLEAGHELRERVGTLPGSPKRWLGRFNRTRTLRNLAERMSALDAKEHGDAA